MSDLFFSTGLPGEFDRLQWQMASLIPGFPARLRAMRSETFPPVNIGSTDDSVEIVAFAPGLDLAAIDVSIDKGVPTISGERKLSGPEADDETRVYATERFMGAFRRVIELPQHAKLEVRVQDATLNIEAEAVIPTPSGLHLQHGEVRHPSFQRAFTLSPELDVSLIDAQLRDGVFELSISRREEAKPRRIEVSVGQA
ncbi:Hsp20 family protein [Paraburkholderia bannensis]|uniref:Hsp20 family protein n=1 Tax=Paraburkholderia bannensis TaxID=765414 RepID=UPI00048A0FDC